MMLSRAKLGLVSFLAGLFVFSIGLALADYTVLDSGGVTRTIKAFVCETTKVCPAHVMINSSGTEIIFNTNGRAAATGASPVVLPSVPSTDGKIAANNTTAVVVKGSAGVMFGAQLGGIGTVPAYVKIYNAASATCGSGTPVKRLIIPAAATAGNGAGSNVSFGPNGLAMGTGITYCITTGITDADATAPAASTYLVNIDYE